MTYIHFVTLNTGTVEWIAPPDATATHPAALDLARALRDEDAPISERPGYRVKAMTAGPHLAATIYKGDMPLTTFGVAARSRSADKLWRLLHEGASGLATAPDDLPSTPWCAIRVEPSMMLDPDQPWRWLATYEVEIATAWIERRHRNA